MTANLFAPIVFSKRLIGYMCLNYIILLELRHWEVIEISDRKQHKEQFVKEIK